jgi:hypothetical protein
MIGLNTPNTERLGIAKLEWLFSTVGWIFREQTVQDIGIDAQVEIRENNISTGQLIAIQVKSGKSYFSERVENNIIYRPDSKHIEYWLRYSLPVIVALYNPEDDTMFWYPIHSKTILNTDKNFKIEISQNFILNKNTFSSLKNVFKLDYTQKRMTKLILDYSWIKMINTGEIVCAEFEDWKNKSLTRTSVKIYCHSKDGYKESYIPQIYAPGYGLFEEIQKIIPWAKFEMDVDSYLKAKEEEYEDLCSHYDKEDGETYYTQLFVEFYSEPEGIVPIKEDEEIDAYSVILKLNKLGEAFLAMAEYLFTDPFFEFTSFDVNEVIENKTFIKKRSNP